MHRNNPRTVLAPALGALALIIMLATGSLAQTACPPTRPDAMGPFYEANAPMRSNTGTGLVLSGTVRSTSGCEPLPNARIEWWSANPQGQYDREHRATQLADHEGRYTYETDFPGRYPGRPPHLHVQVTAPRHRRLVTQIYPQVGQAALSVDLVLIPE